MLFLLKDNIHTLDVWVEESSDGKPWEEVRAEAGEMAEYSLELWGVQIGRQMAGLFELVAVAESYSHWEQRYPWADGIVDRKQHEWLREGF